MTVVANVCPTVNALVCSVGKHVGGGWAFSLDKKKDKNNITRRENMEDRIAMFTEMVKINPYQYINQIDITQIDINQIDINQIDINQMDINQIDINQIDINQIQITRIQINQIETHTSWSLNASGFG